MPLQLSKMKPITHCTRCCGGGGGGGGARPTVTRSLPQLLAATCPATGTSAAWPSPWPRLTIRPASSTSRWKQRQGRDAYARDARVQGLKSRAAFKLLEMDAKHGIFKRNQTIIDLGYAPGSWSQVAMERTKPQGKVVGIDLIPAEAPRGVITFQGDFLSPMVQKLVKDLIIETHEKKPQSPSETGDESGGDGDQVEVERPSYFDMERHASQEQDASIAGSQKRLVDVVLSDMSAPWEQISGFNMNTLSNPYHRLMNTSGMPFRDHAGSMDLCDAALRFASDTLRTGGHFVCKFYQGSEDKILEQKLKKMFHKVHREKPDSSRKESKEAYLIGLRRKANVTVDAEPEEPGDSAV